MIRKIIVAMALMLGVQMSQAQTVSGIFSEFRGEENAMCVRMPWLPMKLVGLFVDDEAKPIIQRIHSVHVLELSDCSDEVQERFATKIRKLKMNGYEPLVAVKEDGSNVKIWGKVEDGNVRELVIGVHGDGDAVLCRIKGKLGMDDIYQMMEMQ